MNSKPVNFGIKLTRQNSEQVKQFFHEHYSQHINVKTCDYLGYGFIYSVSENALSCTGGYDNVITLEQAKELVLGLKFPREMLVYDNHLRPDLAVKRMVLGKFGVNYVTIRGPYNNELETNAAYTTNSYLCADEIPVTSEPDFIEMTVSEIEKKLNLDKKLHIIKEK
jgi:hypothetical protein